MEKKLPLIEHPFTSYPVPTAILSIILQNQNALPWLYNNFIQLYSRNIRFNLGFYHHPDLLFAICPFVKRFVIPRSVMRRMETVVDWMLPNLDDGNYILVMVNGKYIPAYKQYYRKEHFNHPVLIYGYHADERLFYVADFATGRYESYTATFDEMDLAYRSTDRFEGLDDYIGGVNMLHYESAPELSGIRSNRFNTELVVKLTADYLDSRDTYRLFGFNSDDCLYGIRIHQAMAEKLNVLAEGGLEFDDFGRIPFHVLWNHKMCMLDRLNYVAQTNLLHVSPQLIARYEPLVALSLINRNLFLKMQLTGQRSTAAAIAKNITQIVEAEHDILTEWLQSNGM
ncbi:MAG: hypothetical protein J7639_30070 [Paenibacillaceae bacterium]|nr:hypothetical protein [Paenibacillaceae bacterium]